MRLFGGHIFGAMGRRRRFAGWGAHARALAMALLIAAQALALTQGPGSAFAFLGQICETPSAQPSTSAHAPAPATDAHHDCAACLVCAFASAIEARAPGHPRPTVYPATIASTPDAASTPVVRWRAAHPARAPPVFS
ncbi:MAG: hypothetical protein ACR652_20570 [Methylocystis sp.]|uniref:hypothetical protein n=1 Tax=Methylocystis sp. TaxID=1911079 RepID=UPI003DA3167A